MFFMGNIIAFVKAALPWLTIGIVIIVLAVRGMTCGENGKKTEDNYSGEGMLIGMGLGICLGTLFNSTEYGISFGMLAGLVIGSCIRKNKST